MDFFKKNAGVLAGYWKTRAQVNLSISGCNFLQKEIYALIYLPEAFAPGFLHLLCGSSVLSEERGMSFRAPSTLDT